MFEKPLGSWTKQQIADGQCREEDLVVLIWALPPDSQLPAYDVIADQSDVLEHVPHPKDAEVFIANARLRDAREISKARDVTELWLWRARTTQLQREHYPPPRGLTFEGIIAMTAKKAEQGGLFKTIDNDFPAIQKSYAKLSDNEWRTLRSIATERLYGLNWLCGYEEDWDKVPTGT